MTNVIFYHTYENNPEMITLFFQYKLLIKMFFNLNFIKYLETYKWPCIFNKYNLNKRSKIDWMCH